MDNTDASRVRRARVELTIKLIEDFVPFDMKGPLLYLIYLLEAQDFEKDREDYAWLGAQFDRLWVQVRGITMYSKIYEEGRQRGLLQSEEMQLRREMLVELAHNFRPDLASQVRQHVNSIKDHGLLCDLMNKVCSAPTHEERHQIFQEMSSAKSMPGDAC